MFFGIDDARGSLSSGTTGFVTLVVIDQPAIDGEQFSSCLSCYYGRAVPRFKNYLINSNEACSASIR